MDLIIVSSAIVSALVVMATLLAYGLSRASAEPSPAPTAPPPPVTAKGRPLAVCEHCGRQVAVRKGDGMPYAGRHRCVKPNVTIDSDDDPTENEAA
jgi:hypothetical protein